MRKVINYIICIFLVCNLCGCLFLVAGAAGGAGTATWLSGKLRQQVNSSYDNTIRAVKDALQSMNLMVTKEAKAADVDQIRSVYMDGRKIWIDVRPLGERISSIEIRVGALGDKTASSELIKKITAHL